MWLWIIGFFVCAIAALDLMLRRGPKCHRVVDDPSLPLVIPSGGDPLWGIIRVLWRAAVTKENDMVGMLQAIRNKDNPLKMLHSSFFGMKVLITWDPDVFKQVLNPRDDDTITKAAAVVASFDRLLGKSVFAVDGEDWKRQRSVMTPAFHFDRLKRITPKFCVIADRLIQKWREFDDGQAVETLAWMSKMTLDALSLAGFGYDLHALDGSADAAYSNYTFVLKEFASPLRQVPFLDKLDTAHNRKFKKAADDLIQFLIGIVQERKAKGWSDEDADLLHLLSEAHDSGTEGLSDDELAQNLFLFFLAGHETSSTTMNFVLYHLAKYPEHQEAALQEVQQILQGRHPTYDDAKNFKYLEAFIKESLRIFPPAPVVSRKLKHDTEIKGYLVPKDTVVLAISYATQLSAEYFPEPHLFKPERWMSNEKLKHPFAYIPFGAGPRFCIGQYFAMLEMKIALAMILQNFRFSIAPGCEVVKLTRAVSLQTPPGFKIRVHKRY